MVNRFSSQKPSSAYDRCKWCQGSGCLMCPGERRKHQADEDRMTAERTAQLRAMSVEDIFGELESIKKATKLASAFRGEQMSEEEVEEFARTIVLENLAKGGHEYPMPEPVFTSDGSPEQMSEMVEDFHFDRLCGAVAPGGEGIDAILAEAKKVMDKRGSGGSNPGSE